MPISVFRERTDGGTFPTTTVSQQQRRMGTAVTGHGRLYLVTDFVEKIKDPHFVESYDRDIKKYPKSYALKKSDFSTLMNALP